MRLLPSQCALTQSEIAHSLTKIGFGNCFCFFNVFLLAFFPQSPYISYDTHSQQGGLWLSCVLPGGFKGFFGILYNDMGGAPNLPCGGGCAPPRPPAFFKKCRSFLLVQGVSSIWPVFTSQLTKQAPSLESVIELFDQFFKTWLNIFLYH